MSQPTRARTTGGARTPRKHQDQNARGAPPYGTASTTAAQDVSAPSTTTTNPLSPLPAGRGAEGEVPWPDSETSPLTPQTLARTLRAVAAELERDPALARRVAAALAADALAPATDASAGASTERPQLPAEMDSPSAPDTSTPSRHNRAFRPRLITGASPALGTGIPDPFALYSTLGADGLRAALDELRLGTLRAIIREHGLDPNGTVARQHDATRLRAAILAKVIAR